MQVEARIELAAITDAVKPSSAARADAAESLETTAAL